MSWDALLALALTGQPGVILLIALMWVIALIIDRLK